MTPKQMLAQATAPEGSAEAMPKALLIFAHPDDEVIALGARMRRFGNAHLVHVTDGAPRNEQDSRAHGFSSLADYREARNQELSRALERAGIKDMSRECLGISDQEAALRMPELTRAIAQRIESIRPAVIFTHPYEGGHPDHDACAFAVHHACGLFREPKDPLILECSFYHLGPHGIDTGTFLQNGASSDEMLYPLSPEEQERKRDLLDCFTSQRETLSYFKCANERFRIAPEYNFTRPPHQPPVFYDQYPWGTTSERFCQLAREAQQQLRLLEEAACG